MKKVLLICGGNSTEHKISLISANSILKNIDNKKYDLTTAVIDKENNWFEVNTKDLLNWKDKKNILINNIIEYLKSFDVIFPIVHGNNGEDGKLQGMLDLFSLKYVGSKTLASAVGMDKDMSKILFSHFGIPQVPYITIKSKFKLKNIIKELAFPLIVKPANGGSSIGITKVDNKNELKIAIKNAFKFDSKVVVEKFIKARELECAILEDDKYYVSTVGEIISSNNFYDYNAKYESDKSSTVIPAKITKGLESKIQEYAKKAFSCLNAQGIARVDFFYEESTNKIYLNEINTLPGFTKISMYPKLFEYSNIKYQDLISILIENAI